MGLKFRFQKTVVDGQRLLEETLNQFRVVSSKPFTCKRGILGNGLSLVLQVLHDKGQYKEDEDDMINDTFNVTILTGNHDMIVKKHDLVSLQGFREDASHFIDFNYILRFDGIKKLVVKGADSNANG